MQHELGTNKQKSVTIRHDSRDFLSIDPATWVLKIATYIARRKQLHLSREALALTLWLGKIWKFTIGKITSQELLTDPDCVTESAKSVSTSRTGSHARDGVINLRENPSTISSLVLLLGLISWFPTNELRVATNAPKGLRIDYDSVTMSKNALWIWYESRTIFWIGEFVAKVLNS